MKKTICFYIASLTRGGAEKVIVDLANYYVIQGYRVYMVMLEPDKGLYHMSDKIQKIVLQMPCENKGVYGRFRNAMARITQVRKLLKQSKAEVLVSFIGKTNIRAILAGIGTRTKVIVSVRSAPNREYKGIFQRCLSRILFCFADGIVFQSEGAKSFFPKIVQRKSVILLNPLSPEYMDLPNIPMKKRKNRIITVGRMDKVKNHKLLVDAFSIVAKKNPEMNLTIYGDGECMAQVKAQADRLGLTEKIDFPGDVSEVWEKIKDARVFVLSSDFEGMPNAVAEAFAAGIPVVSTDCPSGGVRMLVSNEKTGLLVPVGEPKKMADAILRILEDEKLASRLSQNEYEFSKCLNPDRINGQWKRYMEEICHS